jgi:hypothetical protein
VSTSAGDQETGTPGQGPQVEGDPSAADVVFLPPISSRQVLAPLDSEPTSPASSQEDFLDLGDDDAPDTGDLLDTGDEADDEDRQSQCSSVSSLGEIEGVKRRPLPIALEGEWGYKWPLGTLQNPGPAGDPAPLMTSSDDDGVFGECSDPGPELLSPVLESCEGE